MNIIKWLTSKKYRLFTQKIKDVQVSIWETDFRIFKARQLREESRSSRDNAMQALVAVGEALSKAPKDEKLLADKATLEAQVKGFEAQMFLIDTQIQGVKGVADVEDQTGYMDVLTGLASLREQYKSYLTQI